MERESATQCVTLFFRDPAWEASYLAERSDELLIKLGIFSFVFAVLNLFLWARDQMLRGVNSFPGSALHVAGFFVSGFACALTRSRVLRMKMAPSCFELMAAVFVSVSATFVVFSSDFYASKLGGGDLYPPADGVTQYTNTGMYLCLELLISVYHCTLPVRWANSLITCFVTITSVFVAAASLGSPKQEDGGSNIMMLVLVLCCSWKLKRQGELKDRQNFLLRMHLAADRAGRGTNADRSVAWSDARPHSKDSMGDNKRTAGVSQQLESTFCFEEDSSLFINDAELMMMPECLISNGSFGATFAARFKESDSSLTIMDLGVEGCGYSRLMECRQRLLQLKLVRHPNVASLYGACSDPASSTLGLIFEYVEGLPLNDLLSRTSLCPRDQCQTLHDVSRALKHLHGMRPCAVHGNVKESQVIVSTPFAHPFRAKLIGAGLGQVREVLAGNDLSTMTPDSDVLSFGKLIRAIALLEPTPPTARPGLAPSWAGCPEVERFRQNCRNLCAACTCLVSISRPLMSDVNAQIASWPVPSEGSTFATTWTRGVSGMHAMAWRTRIGARCSPESPESVQDVCHPFARYSVGQAAASSSHDSRSAVQAGPGLYSVIPP